MLGKKFFFAAILGLALVAAGAAGAAQPTGAKAKAKVVQPPPQQNFFDDLINGIGQAFSPDNGFWTGPSQGGLYPDQVSRYRVVPEEFHRQTVSYRTAEKPGTIVIDPRAHFLYYVLGNGQAIRYGVGVGRTGFGWHGTVSIGEKQEWPGWRPPKEMIAREAQRGHKLPVFMPGGVGNPLGARAMYLHNGTGDTGFRIHGTSEPWTIGLNVSSGCIRLVNDDVIDLYQRSGIGTKVIVL